MCRVLGPHRSTQRRIPRGRDDEQQLTDDIVALARRYGRKRSQAPTCGLAWRLEVRRQQVVDVAIAVRVALR